MKCPLCCQNKKKEKGKYNFSSAKALDTHYKKYHKNLKFKKTIVLFSLIFLSGCVLDNQNADTSCTENVCTTPTSGISIMAWNIKAFGMKKIQDNNSMTEIKNTIEKFDISFIQEIRDGTAFEILCDSLPEYSCYQSESLGTSAYKEKYGIVYKKGIELKNTYQSYDFESFERPPLEAVFLIGNYTLKSYLIHTKPDHATEEINSLETYVSHHSSPDNIIILGDLNADCDYFTRQENNFMGWIWLIQDDVDTTVSKTDCAYDRIIVNNNLYSEAITIGTISNISVSDHYPVYVRIATEER